MAAGPVVVIAGRANELLTGRRGGKSPVHPNDHVNMGQSSNDSFPTALHVATVLAARQKLFPALARLESAHGSPMVLRNDSAAWMMPAMVPDWMMTAA